MNEYNAIMIARAEHDQMIRSLPPVSEYGEAVMTDEPGWSSRQVGRFFSALGNGLTSLTSRLKRQQEAAPDNHDQICLPG